MGPHSRPSTGAIRWAELNITLIAVAATWADIPPKCTRKEAICGSP